MTLHVAALFCLILGCLLIIDGIADRYRGKR